MESAGASHSLQRQMFNEGGAPCEEGLLVKRGAFVLQVVLGLAVIGVALGWLSGDLPRWAAKVADRAGSADGPERYGIVPLGWGSSARVRDINAVGAVAGSAYHEDGPLYAALWQDGETTSFHALDVGLSGEVIAVTDDGAVAYTVYTNAGTHGRSYVAVPGAETVCINDLIPGALECRVRGLNARHHAVGTVSFADGTLTFTWSPEDGVTLLDTPFASGVGINVGGVIVGSDGTFNAAGLPSRWTPQADGSYQATYLSRDRGINGRAYAINSAGIIVGRMSGPKPVVWTAAGEMQALPGLGDHTGGWAHDVNDRGEIVGCLNCPGGGMAVLWRDGKAYDLNRYISQPDRWRLVEATAINNDGAIACRAAFDGQAGVVLLVPMEREREVRIARR